MQTGAQVFVAALGQLGIDRLFTLVGDHLNEVLIEAARAGLRIVDFRHESGAGHAADAWARLTRRPALCLVTGGPGHTNMLTALATASAAASPLIAVSGAPPSAAWQRSGFQEIAQLEMAAPVVKWAAQPDTAGQLALYLGRAYAEAASGRMGPVHLTIPANLFREPAANPLPLPVPAPSTPAAPRPEDVERILGLLREARRPVVIAGSGVWWADAGAELRSFLERTRLPYFNVTMARGVIPDSDPINLGYADGALNRASIAAFQAADVVLVLGKRIDYRLAMGGPRLFSSAAKFVQVDIHPQELGRNRALEAALCADVKAALRAFGEALGNGVWDERPEWLGRLRAARAGWQRELDAQADSPGERLHPAAFHRALRDALPAGTLISWDGGDFTHWGRALIPALEPGGWLRLGPLATIGSALPNGIAMKLLNPERPVAVITGDGSLGFYLAELDTLVRHRLPVVVVVGNDAGWGIERELQRSLTGGETVACELRETRYDVVMQGFGGEGETIARAEEVRPAVERAFESGRPYLLNALVRGARSPFTEWQLAGKK